MKPTRIFGHCFRSASGGFRLGQSSRMLMPCAGSSLASRTGCQLRCSSDYRTTKAQSVTKLLKKVSEDRNWWDLVDLHPISRSGAFWEFRLLHRRWSRAPLQTGCQEKPKGSLFFFFARVKVPAGLLWFSERLLFVAAAFVASPEFICLIKS